MLATADAGYPHNPRGWLLDPTIDVGTPAGVAAFRRRVLAWADRSVGILKSIDAQGMVVWDIEGEQFRHPTTYLCDPRILGRAAPEMDSVANEFFATFRRAGLRVGVCVRPQALTWQNAGGPTQDSRGDAARQLIDKISYAKARWGASIFYVDSNGEAFWPLDVDVFRRVVAAHHDVLLIPQHETIGYYRYTAPYREMRRGQVTTPMLARLFHPGAFGVISVADGNFRLHGEAVRAATARGDIVMTRAWFDDPANAVISADRRSAEPTGLLNR